MMLTFPFSPDTKLCTLKEELEPLVGTPSPKFPAFVGTAGPMGTSRLGVMCENTELLFPQPVILVVSVKLEVVAEPMCTSPGSLPAAS
jgi:hypothetical protein